MFDELTYKAIDKKNYLTDIQCFVVDEIKLTCFNKFYFVSLSSVGFSHTSLCEKMKGWNV